MKKFAIGCFAVAVLLAVGGIGIVWYKYGDDISQGVSAVQGFAKIGTEFQELDESIENTNTFTPPADRVLDEQRFDRFLAAHRQMRQALEGRLTALQEKYEALENEMDASGGEAGLGEVAGAYADMANLLLDAKRAQVEALNAHDFSLEEYNWTREQVYRAIGESVAVAAVAQNPATVSQMNRSVPPETVELVEPYRDELMEGYVLAWWGF
ncbi:MAG: hypothetical protein R3323_09210 [Wenzhouxiangellaceae bacterium]|nr:hypothetical protein [Wenzhouxiangellaceae bacterium]